jgi:hypothetical protein
MVTVKVNYDENIIIYLPPLLCLICALIRAQKTDHHADNLDFEHNVSLELEYREISGIS